MTLPMDGLMRNYGTPVALYADRRAVFKYTPPAKIDAVPNEEAGIRELASQSKNLEPAIVLPEASRGVELSPVAALAAEEFTVVVANTRQMRDFAKATWRLAKTDALDAAVLAHSAVSTPRWKFAIFANLEVDHPHPFSLPFVSPLLLV